MGNILIYCAMKKEGKQIAEKLGLKQINKNTYRLNDKSLLIGDIGKQRTAILLAQYLEKNPKTDIIINIGYAGSTNEKIGSWVCISKSYNLEWNIPGEEKYSMNIGNQKLVTIDNLKALPCYSSESFVTETDIKEDAIFDMELHSIALICDMYNIKLISLKKITDNLSIKDYYKNLETNNIYELESSVKFIKDIEKNI